MDIIIQIYITVQNIVSNFLNGYNLQLRLFYYVLVNFISGNVYQATDPPVVWASGHFLLFCQSQNSMFILLQIWKAKDASLVGSICI